MVTLSIYIHLFEDAFGSVMDHRSSCAGSGQICRVSIARDGNNPLTRGF